MCYHQNYHQNYVPQPPTSLCRAFSAFISRLRHLPPHHSPRRLVRRFLILYYELQLYRHSKQPYLLIERALPRPRYSYYQRLQSLPVPVAMRLAGLYSPACAG
jgi:hypothetical protein